MNTFLKFAGYALVALHVQSGFAQATNEVPDSYIVTFRPSTDSARSPILPAIRAQVRPRFGEHSTGQSKALLATVMGVRGSVRSIYDTINAAHFLIDEQDAEKLRQDPRVLRVERNLRGQVAAVQSNPGWALDRQDQTSATLDSKYAYGRTGAGQTIYIIDTRLDLTKPAVAAEFGGRASIFWDINGGTGADCHYPGHGTGVASAAAGNTYGVAKGATLKIVKITGGCTGGSDASDWIMAFNWLAANAPKGTIANLSSSVSPATPCAPTIIQALDDSIKAAHDAGIIIVNAAGNDGCSTDNISMARSQYAFIVGATTKDNLASGWDARWPSSRYGANVSAYASGDQVAIMDKNGTRWTESGTSFAAPYIAGLFAIGCDYYGTCNTIANATAAFNVLRGFGSEVVFNTDGSYILPGKAGRFISKPALWN